MFLKKGNQVAELRAVDTDRVARTSKGACKWYKVKELALVDPDTGAILSNARFRSNAHTKAASYFKDFGWTKCETVN